MEQAITIAAFILAGGMVLSSVIAGSAVAYLADVIKARPK